MGRTAMRRGGCAAWEWGKRSKYGVPSEKRFAKLSGNAQE
jgi:hypothetical protein